MKNTTSKLNIILLITIIILLVISIYFLVNKKSPSPDYNDIKSVDQVQTKQVPEKKIQENISGTSEIKFQTQLNQNNSSANWITTNRFNIKIPKEAKNLQEGIYEPTGTALITFQYDNSLFIWGGYDGSCMPDGNQFPEFQYGKTTIFCVKGLVSRLDVINARDEYSQKALNLFSDFILANQ